MGFTTKSQAQGFQHSENRAVANQTDDNQETSSIQDNREIAGIQRKLQQDVSTSPQSVVQQHQREQLNSDTHPLQRIAEEEEPLQGRFDTAQCAPLEEDEPLQGRFMTAQRSTLEEEEPVQGKFDAAQRAELEEEEPLQGKFITMQRAVMDEEEPLQGKLVAAPSANKTGMPDNLKSGIESLSGVDLSDVRVHRNSSKPAQLNAHAFAQGNDIHLGSGQEKHLPHEAWHVVQQRQGRVKPTMQLAGTQINDDVSLEKEADVMGEKAASVGQRVVQRVSYSYLGDGGERAGIRVLQNRAIVQRRVLSDESEIKNKMDTFSISDAAKESDTALTYVGRFKIWLAKSGDSLDGGAEQSILAKVKIVKSATAVEAVLNKGDSSPPSDSQVGNMSSWVFTNYTLDVMFRPFEYLTDKASKDTREIKGIKSDLAKGDYDIWLAFDMGLSSTPIKAWPLYTADLRARTTILSKESRTLIAQTIHAGISAKVNNLGGNVVGAMGSANIRSGVAANDQFQYPRVPYKTQGVLGGGEGYLNPAYWKKIAFSSFILKDGSVKPSAAVKAAFAGPTRLECLSTTRAVLAKGLLDTFGDDVFDHHFKYKSDNDPGVVIGTNTNPIDRVEALMDTPVADKVDDLMPGDWIYYKNDSRYLQKHPAGLWQGENCVYDGNKKWSGFGLNGMTEQELKTSMERAFNDDPDARDIQRDSLLDPLNPLRKAIALKKDANPIGWLWTSLKRFQLKKFLL